MRNALWNHILQPAVFPRKHSLCKQLLPVLDQPSEEMLRGGSPLGGGPSPNGSGRVASEKSQDTPLPGALLPGADLTLGQNGGRLTNVVQEALDFLSGNGALAFTCVFPPGSFLFPDSKQRRVRPGPPTAQAAAMTYPGPPRFQRAQSSWQMLPDHLQPGDSLGP
jgi:hypothetical protein